MTYLTATLKNRNECCVANDQRKRYSLIQFLIWVLAISTMAILACRDVVALFRQYTASTPVTNVNIRDDSENGIRLPNATMCVEFNPAKDYIEANITEFDYLNFTKNQLREAVQFSKNVLTYADQQTLHRNKSWDSVFEQLSLSFNTSAITGDRLENFSHILAGSLCRLMNVKVRLISEKEASGGFFDVCRWASSGRLPFSTNSENLFCFRIPLDLIVMKMKKLKSEDTSETLDDLNWKHQGVLLEFQPLKLRKVFYKPEGEDELLNTMIFLPELPFSYAENVRRKLMDLPQTRFVHTLSFGKTYGLNYFRNVQVKVEFYISAKYNRLTDKKDCLDIFHETNCYVQCMEESFRGVCNCDRYIFHHFINNRDIELCTPNDYGKCFDKYQVYATKASYGDHNLMSCMQSCTKCATLNLQWQIKEHYRNWLRFQNRKNLKVLCELLNLFLNNTPVTSCRDLLENIGDYIPDIFNDDDDVTTEEDMSKKKFRSLIPKSSLFGTVTYEFSMKSFKYPEYKETVSITKEGFLSQIGGILNLYLGISGMTCFTLILTGVRFVKRRQQRRLEAVEKRSQTTMSMLHAWHILGKEYMNKIRTVKWMSSHSNKNEVTVITIS